jgi:hypothetical protein
VLTQPDWPAWRKGDGRQGERRGSGAGRAAVHGEEVRLAAAVPRRAEWRRGAGGAGRRAAMRGGEKGAVLLAVMPRGEGTRRPRHSGGAAPAAPPRGDAEQGWCRLTCGGAEKAAVRRRRRHVRKKGWSGGSA